MKQELFRNSRVGLAKALVLALVAALPLAACYVPTSGIRDTNPPAGVSPPWPYQAQAVPPAPPRDPLAGQGETPPAPQAIKPEVYPDWLFDGPEGRGFAHYLAQGYRHLAKLEDHQHDFTNAAKFLARAAAVERQEPVEPELLYARTLPLYSINDLAYARQRLTGVLHRGATNRFPKLAAQAQLMFDCWMEQQEENSQPDEVAECRNGFEASVARLEAAYREKAPLPAATGKCIENCAPPPPCLPCPEDKLVLFDLDRAELTPAGRQVIAEATKTLGASATATLVVGGHTDLSGGLAYNDALSKRRLDAVVEALLAAGVPRERLARTGYFGKRQPRVPTADGVRLQDNRRVEIHFLCGREASSSAGPAGAQCVSPAPAKIAAPAS